MILKSKILMTDIILIAIGGAIGSSLRFAINNFITNLGLLNKISTKPFLTIPYNTLFINVTGSLIAGFLYFFFAHHLIKVYQRPNHSQMIFLTTQRQFI